jgi:hypothetical protein
VLSLNATPVLARTTLSQPALQSVNAPARVARVAIVPNSGGSHAFAFGYTHAAGSGPSAGSVLGQLVFLEYSEVSGWQITGPPLDGAGHAFSPQLAALAVTAIGEGWAVGNDEQGHGVILHRNPGEAWRLDGSTGLANGVPANLESISLDAAGNGYASGQNLSVLRLSGGQWSPETVAATNCPGTSTASGQVSGAAGSSANGVPDLVSIYAVGDDDAWAVSGSTWTSLCLLHRSGGTWSNVPTESQFDHPQPAGSGAGQPQPSGSGGGTPSTPSTSGNQIAVGGGVWADQAGDVWVVGKMEPQDPQQPLGDSLSGDLSRPFAIHLTPSGATHTAMSWCPVSTNVSSSGAQQTAICDGPFPLAAFGLTGVTVFGDQVFAGGMGFFHFSSAGCPGGTQGGCWQREPDAVGYLESLAMASPTEGWLVGTGSNFTSGTPLSETLALGHWTNRPSVAATALWPDPTVNELESVALAPDGSGRALGVGQNAKVIYFPGLGWIAQQPDGQTLHSVAWPAVGTAWGVGNQDLVERFDGTLWHATYLPRLRSDQAFENLYGVAFTDAENGWAVGDYGTIFDHGGGSWHRDAKSGSLTASTLYTVTTVPGGALAAGADGTVLVEQGGVWRSDTLAAPLVTGGDGLPVTFYAASVLPDGTAAIGGTDGVILVRSRNGSYSRLQPSVDGTVIALGLSRDGAGNLQVLASVSPRSTIKYVGGLPAATAGWLFLHDPTGWHDIEMGHDLTMWVSTDTGAQHDPVTAIALEPTGVRGWAVGGYPSLTLDSDNHSYERATGRSSVYRVDVGADPTPPSTLLEMPPSGQGQPLEPGQLSFAFLGDSACADGLCSAGYGSGLRKDVILQQAQTDINWVGQNPNGPKLTVFGGNMSRLGLTEELDIFKRSMKGWSMPFYAAIGAKDLLSGLDLSSDEATAGSTVSGTTGQSPPGATTPPSSTAVSNNLYLSEFKDAPLPWGAPDTGSTPARNVCPAADTAGTATPTPGEARTYYALDVGPSCKTHPQARFVFINDSEYTVSSTHDNPCTSAMSQSGCSSSSTQLTWLLGELNQASANHEPSFVIMNVPTQDPRGVANLPATFTANDKNQIETALQQGPSTAAFASLVGGNLRYQTVGTLTVPVFDSGGAGSPLGASTVSDLPSHGWYHAWLLVTVDPNPSKTPTVSSMPVLDSVAMSLATPFGGWDGTAMRAGDPTYATAIGRVPDAGLGNVSGANADSSASRADYITVPAYEPPNGDIKACTPNPGATEADRFGCEPPASTIAPYHRFWVENPAGCKWPVSTEGCVAEFVRPAGGVGDIFSTLPQRDGHNMLVSDDQTGFLCALNPGTAYIDAVIGIHRARQQLVVSNGSGPCEQHPKPIPVPVPPPAQIVPQPPLQAQPAPAPIPVPAHHPVRPPLVVTLPPAVLVPPVPVLAAAPPLPAAGAAAKKQEEKEKAFQQSSEKGDGAHSHQSVAYAGAQNTWDARPAAAGGAVSLMFLILAAAWSTTRRRPEAAIDWRRWQ